MMPADYEQKLDELERLLNDPNSPMEPSKVWALLAEISSQHPGEPHPAGLGV